MAYKILTATYTDRIETLLFDPEAGSLSVTSSLRVGHHPSWITPHPENPAIWFTALEQEDGQVVAIEYDGEGKGKIVGELSSEGADPCTLVVYKGDLLVGNVSFVFFDIPQPDIHRRLYERVMCASWIYATRSMQEETSLRSP
jgi:6-phosphogluconolactonase (cycloisomerase 2 family)